LVRQVEHTPRQENGSSISARAAPSSTVSSSSFIVKLRRRPSMRMVTSAAWWPACSALWRRSLARGTGQRKVLGMDAPDSTRVRAASR
jgi:hypothetical protein